MIQIYTDRGKGGLVTTRKEIIKEKNKTCQECSRQFSSMMSLELDHKIPVTLGGLIFDRSNLKLLCGRCHRTKTTIDISILNSLKKMKILTGSHGGILSGISIEELHKTYLEMYGLSSKARRRYDLWFISEIKSEMYDNRINKRERKKRDER